MWLRRYFYFNTVALLGCTQLALVSTSCSSSDESGAGASHAQVGEVQLDLSLGGDIELQNVAFKVSGNGFEKTGSADVARSNKLKLDIGGIPAGKDYAVSLSGKDADDPKTSCEGSANVDVEAGKQVKATINLQCRKPQQTGNIVVNGELNVCPLIDEVSILPFETSVGGSVKLVARASDADKSPSHLSYLWGANGGKLQNAETPEAVFTCTDLGTFTVSVTADDGDCSDAVTATVICSDPSKEPKPECPPDLLIAYAAAPLQSSTLGTVDVSVKLYEHEAKLPAVKWTATGGAFADPSSAKTQYFCKDPGEQTLTVLVGSGSCVEKATFNVTCSQFSCADQSMEPGEPCKNPLPIVHTFAPNMSHLITSRDLPPDPATTRTRPKDLSAVNVRTASLSIPNQGASLKVDLLATPEVTEPVLAYLASQLKTIPFDPVLHKPLLPLLGENPELQRGFAEVQLPQLLRKDGYPVIFNLPDGFQWVRPWVIRWQASPNAGTPTEKDSDVGSTSQALTGSWTTVRGVLNCRAPGEGTQPLPFVEVNVAGQTTRSDASGAFSVSAAFSEVDTVHVRYQGDVETAARAGSIVSRMTVMNDFHNPRSEHFDVPSGTTTGFVLDVGTLVSTSLDCELFELGVKALNEYHTLVGSSPPAGDFRIKRWEGVDVGTPYAFYDYVVIARNLRSFAPTYETRRSVIFHEFGHTVRHAADGDSWHWNWDNFRWAYARSHSGVEIFNEQYAFNEGFAQYWECTRTSPGTCPFMPAGVPSVAFLDWNEMRIGERLLAMSAQPGFDHRAMVSILTGNRGSIHTFRDFELVYCAQATTNSFCSAGVPRRTKRACPPGFIDDGATCRLPNILAKDSYGRGVGTIPNGCGSDEYDAGLCYDPCPAGFDGVGPVCWERCPSGYHDDGAFCRRDAWIITSDNSACDFWDKCGLTFDAGCSICPAGFHNDGCFCRRDAHIFAKQTRGRGVGVIPRQCPTGKVYDAGLCYEPCRTNYTGVGPVCWGRCPSGYDDHGATCYREPNILVKY